MLGSSSCTGLAQVHQAHRTMLAEPVVKVADSPMRQADAPSTPKRDVQPTSQKILKSAPPTSQKGTERLCSQCKTAKVWVPGSMCKLCKISLCKRVRTARNLMDEGSSGVWGDMDKDKTNEFSGLAVRVSSNIDGSKEIESKQPVPDLMKTTSRKNAGKFILRIQRHTR